MGVSDVNYKNILFTRSDGVNVNCKVTLIDTADLDELFLIVTVENINTPAEYDLFYWLNKTKWTLNELTYFAVNNDLCMKILDKDYVFITSYGNCPVESRIFGYKFGVRFN